MGNLWPQHARLSERRYCKEKIMYLLSKRGSAFPALQYLINRLSSLPHSLHTIGITVSYSQLLSIYPYLVPGSTFPPKKVVCQYQTHYLFLDIQFISNEDPSLGSELADRNTVMKLYSNSSFLSARLRLRSATCSLVIE